MHEQFLQLANEKLSHIDPTILEYSNNKFLTVKDNFDYIEQYAINNELLNTYLLLQIDKGILTGKRKDKPFDYVHDGYARGIYFNHCLFVTRVLIDLHPNLTNIEMDYMLASALGHVLLEKVQYVYGGKELVLDYGIDQTVLDLIITNKRNHLWDNLQLKYYYQKIQSNKLALLVKLADRANIIEQLYESDTYQIETYINESKQHFIPMCIYGKEHYPELFHAINLLSSKIKYMIDVVEILTNKHLTIVASIKNESLQLQEMNANLKRLINKLESNH